MMPVFFLRSIIFSFFSIG
ncbi:hypothetical protein GH741_19590 [Aquibacillus halophilus]|uniref:Uncharacterized protein n=1 Tax=Aquibacillus halophilus TaxID=930132 RepID=A0A6A8DK48_9BACI|nr:hypothetical protein [Aquibacillus halophilus]